MWSDVSAASLVLLAVFLFLSAFFSGSEAALLSVQRVRLRRLVADKTAGAARVERMVEHPERLLPPILFGNNLVNTGLAAIATSIAALLIADQNLAVIVATASVTVVLLIFGETIPKTVAARHAERVSIIVAPAIQGVSWVLKPVSFILQWISLRIAGLFGGGSIAQLVTEEEIKAMVEVGSESGVVEQGEADIIRRVLSFGDRRVSELMTPRPEIIALKVGATIRDFQDLYGSNYHTRFPVVRDELDDIVGTVSVKDVMRALANGAGRDSAAPLESRSPRFVPETKSLDDLFDEMRSNGDPIVMVADEYGGVAGLVTFKRLVESIVGKVEEGADGEGNVPQVEILDDRTAYLDGGLTIADANEQLSLNLPSGEYETVAGFLLEQLGSIPEVGAEVAFANLHFAVLEMRGVRIGRVRVTREPDPEEE
ncbi:MAG: HlyC/CorC family transporter [Chloroflexi bacterium]|nr:HlyC/CorC family transporter [Chloroflexota bacterium]MYB83211.1 HlyC/CorC family transporter [Chloroflexota bacterium]